MKLRDWLKKNKKTREWFGQQFRDKDGNPAPVSSTTVDGWCKEENPHYPQKRYREEITRITGGAVGKKDLV